MFKRVWYGIWLGILGAGAFGVCLGSAWVVLPCLCVGLGSCICAVGMSELEEEMHWLQLQVKALKEKEKKK